MKQSDKISKLFRTIEYVEDLELGSLRTIKIIEDKVKKLETQIDKMKNCWNCFYGDINHINNFVCHNDKALDTDCDETYEFWELDDEKN